jgi:hypothetical protein
MFLSIITLTVVNYKLILPGIYIVILYLLYIFLMPEKRYISYFQWLSALYERLSSLPTSHYFVEVPEIHMVSHNESKTHIFPKFQFFTHTLTNYHSHYFHPIWLILVVLEYFWKHFIILPLNIFKPFILGNSCECTYKNLS